MKDLTRIDADKLREQLDIFKKKTGKSKTWLSYKVSESGSMLSNALIREKIATKWIQPLENAGIPAAAYVIKEEPKQEELPLPDPEDKPEETTAETEALQREIRKLRDDLADLGVLLHAIRDDRNRADEKILQALARINDKQLTQKQLGEEIVGGIIIAASQTNIDEPVKAAYAAIRKAVKKDIYMAIKGDLK